MISLQKNTQFVQIVVIYGYIHVQKIPKSRYSTIWTMNLVCTLWTVMYPSSRALYAASSIMF